MDDSVLVLNAGSSSLKFSIYEVVGNHLELRSHGQIEGLRSSPRFKAKDNRGTVLSDVSLKKVSYPETIDYLSKWIRAEFRESLMPIAVGHRVVHGGLEFAEPVVIDAAVMAKLEGLVPLAPLHQPHNLEAIRAVAKMRGDLPQVACFDTAFHRDRAIVTERFGLPDELFQMGVRRWGFHGLSYQSISHQFGQIAPELARGRVIVAHLGSGASLCAMKNGRSVDTTMSFSVLDGLPMGTRCGSLDPGVVLYLLQSKSREEVEELLYTKSGLLGISGISNDIRDLLASNDPKATAAVDYFVYRIIREIGSLTAALGGLDALIFTAGIGENSALIRQRVCDGLNWLGIMLDGQANEKGRDKISDVAASPSVWVLATDEERVIAEGTLQLIREPKA